MARFDATHNPRSVGIETSKSSRSIQLSVKMLPRIILLIVAIFGSFTLWISPEQNKLACSKLFHPSQKYAVLCLIGRRAKYSQKNPWHGKLYLVSVGGLSLLAQWSLILSPGGAGDNERVWLEKWEIWAPSLVFTIYKNCLGIVKFYCHSVDLNNASRETSTMVSPLAALSN